MSHNLLFISFIFTFSLASFHFAFAKIATVEAASPLKTTPPVSKALVFDKIIASVNSEAILQSDLADFTNRFKKEGSLDETLFLDENPESYKNNSQNQLQFLIREKLIEAEIKRQNLGFTEERVNQEMETLAKRNRMNAAELEAYIKKQGYSLAEYKRSLKSRLERQGFFESEIVAKLRITDDDAYNEYKNKTPNFKPNANEYKIAQIFFKPEKGSEQDAQKRAEEVLKKIILGESFESLANKFTEEKGAAKNGYLGQFKTGEFNQEIERAVANLDTNQITSVVRTKQGFHIFKVLEKKISQDPNFLRFKEQIKASLIEQNFKRQLKNWFESKKQDAYITYYE